MNPSSGESNRGWNEERMNPSSGETNRGWNEERMNPSSGEITGVETTKPNSS